MSHSFPTTDDCQSELMRLAIQLDSIEERLGKAAGGNRALHLLHSVKRLRSETTRLQTEEAELLERQSVIK